MTTPTAAPASGFAPYARTDVVDTAACLSHLDKTIIAKTVYHLAFGPVVLPSGLINSTHRFAQRLRRPFVFGPGTSPRGPNGLHALFLTAMCAGWDVAQSGTWSPRPRTTSIRSLRRAVELIARHKARGRDSYPCLPSASRSRNRSVPVVAPTTSIDRHQWSSRTASTNFETPPLRLWPGQVRGDPRVRRSPP